MQYLAVSALSHDGLLRDHNEDSLAIGPWTTCATSMLTPETLAFPIDDPLVVAVADGLGGHPAGDDASTIVVQNLARLTRWFADERSARAAIDGCNRAVYDAATREPAKTGMGTTVAGVAVTSETVLVFNVGDSRVYVMADDGLTRLSVDDSPPLAPGETTTSIVTQTLGGSPAHAPVDAHVSTRPLAASDRYLVCSDGLSDAIPEQDIASIMGRFTGLEAVFELWQAAMKAGGPDNITIALLDIVSDDDQASEGAEA